LNNYLPHSTIIIILVYFLIIRDLRLPDPQGEDIRDDNQNELEDREDLEEQNGTGRYVRQMYVDRIFNV